MWYRFTGCLWRWLVRKHHTYIFSSSGWRFQHQKMSFAAQRIWRQAERICGLQGGRRPSTKQVKLVQSTIMWIHSSRENMKTRWVVLTAHLDRKLTWHTANIEEDRSIDRLKKGNTNGPYVKWRQKIGDRSLYCCEERNWGLAWK